MKIRNLFFKTQYRGKEVGVDGFALDVMRGRDSGTAPFVDYFKPCLSKEIESWDDLEPYFEPNQFELLKSTYEDIKDIDLLAAIFLEKRCGNLIGKIGGCIMVEQFYRYKYGDRFFSTHSNNPHNFTLGLTWDIPEDLKRFIKHLLWPIFIEQISEIKGITFSQIICMSTSIEQVPVQGFVSISTENPTVMCNELNAFNFELFQQSQWFIRFSLEDQRLHTDTKNYFSQTYIYPHLVALMPHSLDL